MQFETKFALDENDYLALQLYTVSKDKQFRNSLRISLVLIVIILLPFTIIEFGREGKFIGYHFLFLLYVIAFFMVFTLKDRYRKFYIKSVRKTYHNNFGQETTIAISDDLIKRIDNTGESNFKISQIQEVIETGQHIFVQMLSAQWYVFPKEKIQNIQDLRTVISQIVTDLGVKHTVELNWKWK